jgi:hypothetical protein
METKSKAKYIKAWESHIDSLNILTWTPNPETSRKVSESIKNLKELVKVVADEKWSRKKLRKVI